MSDLDLDNNDINKFGDDLSDDIKPIETGKMEDPSFEDSQNSMLDQKRNMIHKGDYVDLLEKYPTLRELYVAVGWDQKSLEEKPIDIDICCFLLDKDDQTRDDEDFIFYNNMSTCDGAVRHLGDNRTGAADGDDETIFLELNGIPFDVLKIKFVMSIYDEDIKGDNFGDVRNVFLRMVNKEDSDELVRLEVKEEDIATSTGFVAVSLVREGPKWFVDTQVEPVAGGLTEMAKEHGIIVQEDTG